MRNTYLRREIWRGKKKKKNNGRREGKERKVVTHQGSFKKIEMHTVGPGIWREN